MKVLLKREVISTNDDKSYFCETKFILFLFKTDTIVQEWN